MHYISHIKRISSCRYPRPNIEFLLGGCSCGKRRQAGRGGVRRITRHFQRVCTQHLGLGECCNEPVAGHTHLACHYSLLPSPVPSARISTHNNLRLRLHPPRKQLPHKHVRDVAAAAASRSLARALLEFAHHVLRIHVSASIGTAITVQALALQLQCKHWHCNYSASIGIAIIHVTVTVTTPQPRKHALVNPCTFSRLCPAAAAAPSRHMNQQQLIDHALHRRPHRAAFHLILCGRSVSLGRAIARRVTHIRNNDEVSPRREPSLQPSLLLLGVQGDGVSRVPRALQRN
jgi:hypothetical protein